MGKKIDETGNRYGRLTVIKEDPNRNNHGLVKWICQCDCGNIVSVCGNSLRTGKTKSCGCYNKQKITEANEVNILIKIIL